MTTSTRPWLVGHIEHEGFPLYFRRPDVKIAEFETLRPKYPRLLVVTHALAEVMENGIPDPDYNRSLEPLGMTLTEAFEDESEGLIALIETFAGKRTYYTYLAPSFVVEDYISIVTMGYPQEDLTYEVDNDPNWRLIKGYAADFDFF